MRGVLRLSGVSLVDEDAGVSGHDELMGAVDILHREGEVERDERDMFGGLLELSEIPVSDVMIHRTKMRLIDADLPPEELVREVIASPYTRMPLWRGEPDNIIGVLHAKDLLRAYVAAGGDASKLNIADLTLEPWFIPESTTLRDQLQAFLGRKMHSALVVDEYGVVQGLITLEDIIEEIVGDIRDEHDVAVQGVRKQRDGSVVVDGSATIRDLNRAMGWNLPDDEAATVAGLVIHEARSIPEPRQTFSFHGFRFEVLRKQRNRIAALRITPLAPRAPEPPRRRPGRRNGAPMTEARSDGSRPSADARRPRGVRCRVARHAYISGQRAGLRPGRGLDVLEQSRRRPVAVARARPVGPGAVRPAPDRRPRGDHPPRSGGPWQTDPGRVGRRRRARGSAAARALFLALAAVLLWFAWGTFYTVQPNEVGINLVFGRYTGKTAAGLNTNWPWPIGSVIKVPVWDQQITEVGYRSLGGSADIPEESQMLTGDKNIVDVHFRVNWQIDPAKPEDYVFNILNPRETVKAVAESIMREVVGLKTIDGILTTDRESVEADVQKRMQNVLDGYRAGVLVKQVQLQSVDAPSSGPLRLSRRDRRPTGPAARRQRG